MLEEPDDIIASIEHDVARAADRAERLPRLEAAMTEIRASARNSRRDVLVETDSAGGVTALRIGDAALTRGGERLAREILQLIAEARSRAADQVIATAADILGEDDPAVELIRAQYQPEPESQPVRN